MGKFANLVVRYRWSILVIVVLLTVFFGYQLKHLKVDSNVVDSLPKNDSIVRSFKEVGERFGGNEMGMIIIKNENVLNPDVLNIIHQITDTLTETSGILSVTSLTNMMDIKTDGDNFKIGNLIDSINWPKNKGEADRLKNEIVKNDMVAGNLISKDGTAAIIFFTFQADANIQQVSDKLTEKVATLHLPVKYYFYGSSFITKYVADVVAYDLIKLIPIAFLVIAVILFLSFRSVRGIILPLLTAGLAIVWAMGTFVMFGFRLSMVSNNVPIIIIAVGSAYTIHVLNQVNYNKNKERKIAVMEALCFIAVPVIFTALTTMVGFLSFIVGSYLSMIKDFGLLAALGTFYSAFLALVFVPALISIMPAHRQNNKEKHLKKRKSLLSIYILFPLYRLVTRHSYLIIVIWIVLFIVSISGVFMIKRSVTVSGYFKPNHPISVAEKIMQEKFGGSKPLFVVFKGDMQNPKVLDGMLEMEKYMQNNQFVSGTQSVADIIAKLNNAMGSKQGIPENEEQIQQLWFLLDQQKSMSQLVTENLDQGIIIVKFNDIGLKNIIEFNKYMQPYLTAHPSKDYTVEMTGMPFINARMDSSLIKSQIGSLIVAILLVILLVSLIFWSIVKGLYASLPILATIAVLFGIMGLTGIPLNMVTVLVASIAMGIGIDYSIHFISHFNYSLNKYRNLNLAIKETMLISGKAIIINFISVTAGFLVLLFSELVPMIYFGVLIAFGMLGSSLGALTLLPAMFLIKSKNHKI